MCGRFSLAVRIGYLADRFGISEFPEIPLPMFNIAPAEMVPVITGNGSEHCSLMSWGLDPQKRDGEKHAPALVNVRSEGLAGKYQFRNLLTHGRCIVPATGFYEWGKTGSQTFPMYFRLKNEEIFGMAGLCYSWQAPDGRMSGTFTVITTSPNSLTRSFHDRMPAILRKEDEKKWLDTEHGSVDEVVQLLKPFPSGEMETFRVTKRVNSPLFKSETAVVEEISELSDLDMWDTR